MKKFLLLALLVLSVAVSCQGNTNSSSHTSTHTTTSQQTTTTNNTTTMTSMDRLTSVMTN